MTSPMTNLSDLISRVSAASGANPELNLDVAVALGLFKPVKTRHERTGLGSYHTRLTGAVAYQPPNFTASVDAALVLVERVLPGRHVSTESRPGTASAVISKVAPSGACWSLEAAGTAPTLPLALLLALLRAVQASSCTDQRQGERAEDE